jgi:hypothetical protein
VRLYLSYPASDRVLAGALTRVLVDGGHEVASVEGLYGSDLASAVTSAIRRSDGVIAFPGSLNPNVVYEMGVAAGADIPVIMVMPSDVSVASDLRSIPAVIATGQPAVDAAELLRRVGQFAPRGRQAVRDLSPENILAAALHEIDAYEALSPREFEEVVAQLLIDRGFDIEQPPRRGDHGYDMAIRCAGPSGTTLVLVQCKKLSAQARVSAHVVRELYEAVQHTGATAGLLVTSSDLTSSARAVADQTGIRLLRLDDLLAMRAGEWTPLARHDLTPSQLLAFQDAARTYGWDRDTAAAVLGRGRDLVRGAATLTASGHMLRTPSLESPGAWVRILEGL